MPCGAAPLCRRHGRHGDVALVRGLVTSSAAAALHRGQTAGWRAEPAYESKPHHTHAHRNNNTAIMKGIIKVSKNNSNQKLASKPRAHAERQKKRANSDEPSETSIGPALKCRAEPRPFAGGTAFTGTPPSSVGSFPPPPPLSTVAKRLGGAPSPPTNRNRTPRTHTGITTRPS